LTNLPPTPVKSLEMAYNIAKDSGLNYPYIGNVPGHMAEKTYCPSCGKTVIDRSGYTIRRIDLDKGNCKFCGQKIAGIW